MDVAVKWLEPAYVLLAAVLVLADAYVFFTTVLVQAGAVQCSRIGHVQHCTPANRLAADGWCAMGLHGSLAACPATSAMYALVAAGGVPQQVLERQGSLHAVLHACLACWLLFNVVLNHVLCVFTPPGYTTDAPAEPKQQVQQQVQQQQQQQQVGGGCRCVWMQWELHALLMPEWRWCRQCALPKPPLAHHCSICNKWLGSAYSSLMTFLAIPHLFDIRHQDWMHVFLPFFLFALAMCVFVALSCLMGWHVVLIATGQGTIDAIAAHAHAQHREAVKAGQDGKVVISCDWSEKLTVERSVEIMSEHWHAQQIGILVACAYFKNKEGVYKEHTVYVMTDGKEQSAAITQAAVNQVVCYLLAEHDMDMRQLYMWSDGCAGQFKGAPAMRQHWGMAQRFSMPVWWSYGATAHFKGRHDSEGGVVKQWLRGEILADRVGKCNALGFVQHCNAYHKPAAAADPSKAHRARASVGHRWCLELSTREVELCSAPQRDAHVFASSIPGSMSMHSCFFPAAGIQVEWSETACACAQCMTPAPRGVCMRPSITKPFVAMPMFDQKRDDKHWDDECLTLLCSFAPDSVKQLCTLGKKLSVKMLNEYCKAVGLYVPANTLRADLRYMVLEHLNGQAEWD
ncbi:hypothetical protein QJQ45_017614 [Haematococcus lacustris]|nr:hypothetical protein QJQ45_017614 [Haematococcus lacustris]